MTYPIVVHPGNRVTGDRLNAAFLIGRAVFSAYRDTAQSISSGGVGIAADALQWDNVALDLLGGWTASTPSRYTATIPGRYRLEGAVSFQGSAAGDSRGCTWRVNGTVAEGGTSEPIASGSIANTSLTCGARDLTVVLNGTSDYVELCPFQDSGAALGTSGASRRPFISVTYVGPT
ncbi:hypothetical protein ACTWP5_27545 [Streptomyces sp. 4N509B]|uniref:hypothetical protein n=1 Tax=Streptomyces sp. 4N509B TaxID=3457413 RepID=UPI003FD12C45